MPAVHGQCLHEGEQRFCHLAKVGHLGQPVVLLEVDVHRVVRPPRCPQIVRPQSLQVGWDAFGARTGYQQVASILHVQCFQIGVVSALVGIVFQLLLGCPVAIGHRSAQKQFHPVVEVGIVGHMLFLDSLVIFLFQGLLVCQSQLLAGLPLPYGVLVKTVKAGFVDKIQGCFGCVCNQQRRVGGLNLSLLGHCPQHRTEMNAVLLVAHGMSLHHDEVASSLDSVWYLSRQVDFQVDASWLVGCDVYADDAVGM